MMIAVYRTGGLYSGSPDRDSTLDRLVEQVVAAVGPDVLVVLDLPAADLHTTWTTVRALATATGMSCSLSARCTAVPGAGILWRDTVAPVPGGWGVRTAGLVHPMCWLAVSDQRRPPVTVVAYRGCGCRPESWLPEAQVVMSVVDGPDPTVLAGGFVTPSAARVRDRWYDPGPGPAVDREPDRILHDSGLRDAMTVVRERWRPTSGHWPGDPHGQQRQDRLMVNAAAGARLHTAWVHDTPTARAAGPSLMVCASLA